MHLHRLLLAAVACLALAVPPEDNQRVDVILKVIDDDGRVAANAISLKNNCPNLPENFNVMCISVPSKAVQGLQRNPHIKSLEFDSVAYKLGSPDDESTSNLRHRNLEESVPYGISRVGAYSVPDLPSPNWLIEKGSGIKVCIVDTGYSPDHPDLPGRDWVSGSNGGNGVWDADRDSHGTHCAGTVAAKGGNGVGVVGVLDGADDRAGLHITRGLNDQGSSSWSEIINAVGQCQSEGGANVISMSLGGSSGVTAFRDLLANLHYCHDTVIVAAAGNSGGETIEFPVAYQGAISVASITSSDARSSFSTYNNQVEVAAPGSGVLSTVVKKKGRTYNYVYESWSGTSMATPHVAGVIAKVWSKFPNCNSRQMRRAVADSSTQSGSCDKYLGHGIIQLDALHNHVAAHYTAQSECILPEGSGCGGCLETDESCTPDYIPTSCDAPPPPPSCGGDNADCSVNSDCCNALVCNSGKCGSCVTEGFGCSFGDDLCCSGLDCDSGTCVSCGEPGDSCSVDSDCCSELTCKGGKNRKTCR